MTVHGGGGEGDGAMDAHLDTAVAVVGMAARVPGARDPETFWENLQAGVESVETLTREELEARGVDPALLDDPAYVYRSSALEGAGEWDAGFWGFSPREAAVMDPQTRHFIELCWEGMEKAGYAPGTFPGPVGVFGGCGPNTYMMFQLLGDPAVLREMGFFLVRHIGNDKDFLATRASYHLNLTGPGVGVQTACSTSLTAIHLAVQSLLAFECDMALAGGVTITFPHRLGYLFQEGEILSPDGSCRAFDADSEGTVLGDGGAVVVLRRLRDALEAGDTIHAVIRGSAMNNDGSAKVGYLAPSVEGQARVIAEALAVADVSADSIGYLEAHGTGTRVGDPIEVAALTEAYRAHTDRTGYCWMGSVKTNIGHLDTAAGVAGFLKAALAVRDGVIPPSLHFQAPNPGLALESSPFRVPTEAVPFPESPHPRRAGVSSLGVGGTNVHVILEAPPAPVPSDPDFRSRHLVVLSARNRAALERASARLVDHLEGEMEREARGEAVAPLADTAWTLQAGRARLKVTRTLVARTREEIIDALLTGDPERIEDHEGDDETRSAAFLFAGGGAQYAGMARDLWEEEPLFREEMDGLLAHLRDGLGETALHQRVAGLLGLHGAPPLPKEEEERPSVALPALFMVQLAQARLWMSWGVTPSAMIGHSMGEYTAAVLAEVLSAEEALELVVLRGRLFERVERGGMLSVPLSEEDLRALLAEMEGGGGEALSVAAVNGPELTVASGPVAAIEALEGLLGERGVEGRRIHIEVAAHSSMLEPILEPFRTRLREARLSPPVLPFVSNLTGGWITPAEATDPEYWVRQLRETVRFSHGLERLLDDPSQLLLEVGPGRTLATLSRLHPARAESQEIFTSIRHPDESVEDDRYMLQVLGRLWQRGVEVDWEGVHDGARRHRVPLPTYPFERDVHMVEPVFRLDGQADPRLVPGGADGGSAGAAISGAPAGTGGAGPVGAGHGASGHGASGHGAALQAAAGGATSGSSSSSGSSSAPTAPSGPSSAPLSAPSGATGEAEGVRGDLRPLGEWLHQVEWRVRSEVVVEGGDAASLEAPDTPFLLPEGTTPSAGTQALLEGAGIRIGTPPDHALPRILVTDALDWGMVEHGVHQNGAGVGGSDPTGLLLRLLEVGKGVAERVTDGTWEPGPGGEPAAELIVLTRGATDGSGDPAGALAAGPVRVFAAETPGLVTRWIDLPADAADPDAGAADGGADASSGAAEPTPPHVSAETSALLREALALPPVDEGAQLLALRDGGILVPGYGPVQEASPVGSGGGAPALGVSLPGATPSGATSPGATPTGALTDMEALPHGAVCVITGGYGGVGLEVARHLARSRGARIALLGRTALPDDGAPALDPRVRRAQAVVRELEAEGAEVLPLVADVTDEASLVAARDRIIEEFGAVDALFHAAGVLDDGLALLKEPAAAARVLAPKVRGTLLLDRVFGGPAAPEVVVLFSSVSAEAGLPGQVDYAAANAFLDAWARKKAREGESLHTRWISVGWSAWAETGMAVDSARGLVAWPPLAGSQGPWERARTPLFDAVDREGGRVRVRLREGRLWMLDEHRTADGLPLIPGAGYLELVRGALEEVGGPASFALEELYFVAPFFVPQGATRELELRLPTGDAGEALARGEFVVMGRGAPDEPWTDHVRGRLAEAGGDDTLAAAAAAPTLAFEKGTQGEGGAAKGAPTPGQVEGGSGTRLRQDLDLGPRWSNVRGMAEGSGEGVEGLVELALELDPSFETDLAEHPLHPALLDNATALAGPLLPGFGEPGSVYVPASYGQFTFRRAFRGSRIRSWIGRTEISENMVTLQVRITDEDGTLLAQARDFVMVRLPAEELEKGTRAALEAEAARGKAVAEAAAEGLPTATGIGVLEVALRPSAPPHLLVTAGDPEARLARLREAAATSGGRDRGGRKGPDVDVTPVEEALAEMEAVQEAAVTAHEDRPGEIRLVAHLVMDPEHFATVSEIRRGLRAVLPRELVPQNFVQLDALPRTRRGAVDRGALHDPFAPVDRYVAPVTPSQEVVARVWGDLLGSNRVGIHDNFLDIGGHSLLAMRAIVRIEKETGYRIGPVEINLLTLEQIAAKIEEATGGGDAPEPAGAGAGGGADAGGPRAGTEGAAAEGAAAGRGASVEPSTPVQGGTPPEEPEPVAPRSPPASLQGPDRGTAGPDDAPDSAGEPSEEDRSDARGGFLGGLRRFIPGGK